MGWARLRLAQPTPDTPSIYCLYEEGRKGDKVSKGHPIGEALTKGGDAGSRTRVRRIRRRASTGLAAVCSLSPGGAPAAGSIRAKPLWSYVELSGVRSTAPHVSDGTSRKPWGNLREAVALRFEGHCL